MFGLLGHNNLSAGCAVRYHITVMFIQIQSSPIVKCTKLYAPCHSQHRAFLHCNPNKCMRRHIFKHTITPQIRVLIWSYSRPALLGFLNYVHCILCCNDRLHALHASVHQSSISSGDSCGSGTASGGYHSSQVDNKRQFCSIC